MSNELALNTDIQLPEITNDGVADLMRQAEAMSYAHKLASVLCNTAMVPATFKGKPDDGAAAILYGAEVGLKPQQALQQVFVIHGQPAIYARTMVALLKAKGYKFETVESTDTTVTVRGTSPAGEVETSTWTIDRAKKAGYTSNKKYQTDPQAMLYAKAASEVSRRLAPDVLLGIKYTAEDLELEPIKAEAKRLDVHKQRGKEGLRAALEAKKHAADEPPAEQPEEDWATKINAAESKDKLGEIMAELQALDMPDDEYELLAKQANTKWEELN